VHKEIARRFVKNRPAEDFLATCGCDEFLVEKGFDHTRRVHATDFLNLGNGDGLFVCNDRKRFQRGQRQARGWDLAFDKFPENLVMLRLRRKLQSVRDLTDLDTVFGRTLFLDQLLDRLLNFRPFDIGQGFADRTHRHGLLGKVDNGFKQW